MSIVSAFKGSEALTSWSGQLYGGKPGDRRAGVVWHTQGSGKSLAMLMLAGTLVRAAEMANPTLVIVTDRNDLDDQLFDTFAMGRDSEKVTSINSPVYRELTIPIEA